MNNKGQSLVMFILLLPIIIMLFGYLIEISIIAYTKVKVSSVTKSIIANCIDECEKDDIILLYDKNDITVDDLEVDNTSGFRISLKSSTKSFLGSLIGKDKYLIDIDIKGIKENNKIKYEKGS